MNTVGQTIGHVSSQLSDQRRTREYTRWSLGDLVEYLNQGLKEIGAYRPEAFARTYKATLVPGRVQKLDDGAILQSISETNKPGRTAHSSSSSLLKAFGAYYDNQDKLTTVNGVIQYAVKSFARDKTDPTIFYVSPPVPMGLSPEVTVQVNSRPTEYTLGAWDTVLEVQDKYYNNLIDFMLARAYAKDTESQVSAAKAQRLLQLFYQAMGAKYKIDSARNSGYYLGDVGTGDPRSAV